MEYEQTRIWYKESHSSEEILATTVEFVQKWYHGHLILLGARFSFDEGRTWESIIDLRKRNGLTYPFIPKIDGAEEGLGGIAAARRAIAIERAKVEELERQNEALKAEVEEQENMVERMLEIERKLDELKGPKSEKYTQIEGRQFKIANRGQKENQAAEKKTAGKVGQDKKGKASVEHKKAAVRTFTNTTFTKKEKIVVEKRDEGGKGVAVKETVDETKNTAIAIVNEIKKEVNDYEGSHCGIVEKKESSTIASVVPRLSSLPPPLFPMLQTTTMPNDYAANDSSIALLRSVVEKGIPISSMEATTEMFAQPPTCSLCPDARPLIDLKSFLDHVLHNNHIRSITSSGGKISVGQVFYWKTIVETGSTTRKPV
ncbi:hypothetical protein PRIPAC_97337 [Pristionchus pacificus]|uniref:Uncharacterized protein n=1 Tax=Pristionchus pacificus TaxID=54126 RepID=A0A2A6CTZ2_PRIPA|nr:hypothetical protein PRIPAC_97337 [Pristionchus pacificus]|eukprot:PDM81556.1 hypothetical protein PRIPAC_30537 [Pristionchus pacificus]